MKLKLYVGNVYENMPNIQIVLKKKLNDMTTVILQISELPIQEEWNLITIVFGDTLDFMIKSLYLN